MICKNYFSGFCLDNEKELFKDYLIENDFSISGFSYGAIKAFEEVLNSNTRIDTLQLFSPAFFQVKDKKFKRTQLMFFKKDPVLYSSNFLESVSYPSLQDCSKYLKLGTYEELEEVLNYIWDEEKLKILANRDVNIEVYLGEKDQIVDTFKAREFFTKYANVYFIKEKGHIL